MAHGDLAHLAAVVGAVGAAAILLARSRVELVAGFALLAVAEALLAVAIVPAHDLERLERPAGAAALGLGLVVVAAGAVLFAQRPALAAPALLIAAPFRVPIQLGSQKAFLLLPLYAVLAAAALGFLYRRVRDGVADRIPLALAVPAAAFVAIDAMSLLWSKDVRQGSIELLFFIFPFTAVLVVAARSPLASWSRRAFAVILVTLASAFAIVGLWQAATHRIFFAQDLRVANTYTSFFRVTSLFKDPNLYGRWLVFGFVVIVLAVWLRRLNPLLAVALCALLWFGLYFSYSQTSMVTLVVVLLALTAVAGDPVTRRAVAVTGVVAVAVAAVFVGVYATQHSPAKLTSGRTKLVSVTARVIRDHPLVGVGVGAQPKASHAEASARGVDTRDASHTTPLTVAAELGAVGALAYLALLVGSVFVLRDAYRRDPPLGLGLSAVVFALFVHALAYAGFFEEPLLWGALGVAAALGAANVTADTSGDGRGRWHTARSAPCVAPSSSSSVSSSCSPQAS
jgi:uncharacterized membrane protein